jgi:hypothetical protein
MYRNYMTPTLTLALILTLTLTVNPMRFLRSSPSSCRN